MAGKKPTLKKPNLDSRRQYGVAIKDLLPSLSEHIGQKNSRKHMSLQMNWGRIVGEEFAQLLVPVRVKYDGRRWILLVRCLAGGGLAMSYAEGQICERVNSYFGRQVIEGMKIISEVDNGDDEGGSREIDWDLYGALRKLSEDI